MKAIIFFSIAGSLLIMFTSCVSVTQTPANEPKPMFELGEKSDFGDGLLLSKSNVAEFPPLPEGFDFNEMGIGSIALLDIDRDGDLDVISALRGFDYIYLGINDGNKFGALKPFDFFSGHEVGDIILACDLDSDGLDEIIASSRFTPYDFFIADDWVFESTGTEELSLESVYFTYMGVWEPEEHGFYLDNIVVGNYDDKGAVDIFVIYAKRSEKDNKPVTQIHIAIAVPEGNDYSISMVYHLESLPDFNGIIYLTDVGDFNGDGFSDILLASFGSPEQFTVIDLQSGLVNTYLSPFKSKPGISAMEVKDINGDGFDDVVYAGVYHEEDERRSYIAIAEGRTEGLAYKIYEEGYIPSSPEVSEQAIWNLATGDFNGDGYYDFFTTYELKTDNQQYAYPGGEAGCLSPIMVLLSSGEGEYQSSWKSSSAYGSLSSMLVKDINNDGLDELFFLRGGCYEGEPWVDILFYMLAKE
jgi:hypothetical protein